MVYKRCLEFLERHEQSVSKIDKDKTLSLALEDYHVAKEVLLVWANMNDAKNKNLREIAVLYMSELLQKHKFYELLPDGKNYKKGSKPLVHPLASKDTVECMTDVSSYEPEQLARMLLDVNYNARYFYSDD